jgi:protein-tyrosine phosphatase
MFNSILVVCVGNICRSPTGERLLLERLPTKNVSSAGIAAVFNSPADSMASAVASSHGLTLDGHTSKQLTKEMCLAYDLILVMEKKHIDLVCKISAEVRGKTMLFGHWHNKCEIPDPYRQSREAFEFVYSLLEQSARGWVNALNR